LLTFPGWIVKELAICHQKFGHVIDPERDAHFFLFESGGISNFNFTPIEHPYPDIFSLVVGKNTAMPLSRARHHYRPPRPFLSYISQFLLFLPISNSRIPPPVQTSFFTTVYLGSLGRKGPACRKGKPARTTPENKAFTWASNQSFVAPGNKAKIAFF
jgi:hypothetical protein